MSRHQRKDRLFPDGLQKLFIAVSSSAAVLFGASLAASAAAIAALFLSDHADNSK